MTNILSTTKILAAATIEKSKHLVFCPEVLPHVGLVQHYITGGI